MKEPSQPLAEVFGHLLTDQSSKAERYRSRCLCPFNNKVPNCTKDKAINPLGVCSVYAETGIAITCPTRFRQDWIIVDDAAEFLFPPKTKWTTLTEVCLNDKNSKSVGNIGIVLAAYNEAGEIVDFGALEVQAVHLSGDIRNPFERYMQNPEKHAGMDWRNEENYPRPDYLSPSRKQLANQLLFKSGILNAWRKRLAVALNEGSFQALQRFPEVSKEQADIAWLIYDLKRPIGQTDKGKLFLSRAVYTKRLEAPYEPSLSTAEPLKRFMARLESEMERVVV